MSDYVSKSELIELLYNTFDEYRIATDKQDALGGFGAELFKRVKALPTLDEKEIIRKAFERVLESLKHRELEHCANRNQARRSGFYTMVELHQRRSEECQEIIKIIKEECGISE